jgi:hypothetical protein
MLAKRPARRNIGCDLVPSALQAVSAALGESGDIAGGCVAIADRLSLDLAGRARGIAQFDFHQGDGMEFLRRYPFTGRELVYADPPYLLSARSDCTRDIYHHEMTDHQHRDLLKLLRGLRCMVMISGYASHLYDSFLEGWHVTTFQAMTRRGPATEWLWCNFAPPVELHDYRYLGKDYREREKIRRQKQRWVARLERMPALQRQALLSAIASIDISSEGARANG